MSPKTSARHDAENSKYHAGASLIQNFLPQVEGPLVKRYGTRFVGEVKDSDNETIIFPFRFSSTDAYIVEAGSGYFRFHRDRAPIGAASEVSTPYSLANAKALQTAQSFDVQWLVDGEHEIQELRRLAATTFELAAARMEPPPTKELPIVLTGSTLTAGALSGTSVTVTSNISAFLEGDVGREIVRIANGDGRMTIKAVASGTSITVNVTEPLSALSIPAGDWNMTGTPVTRLSISDTGPTGKEVEVNLQGQGTTSELVTNGTFAAAGTGWTDLSGPVIVTGTHTGNNDEVTFLQDTAANFTTAGVQPGHTVNNLTDGSSGAVATILSSTELHVDDLLGGSEDDFDTNDDYEIRETGSVVYTSGAAKLAGETSGTSWIQQGITTVVGEWYRLIFDIRDSSLSVQIGATSQGSEVYAEATFAIGNEHEIIFVAESTTTYIQFRNNQVNPSILDNVSCKSFTLGGLRAQDTGKYLYARGGIIKILSIPTTYRAIGVVLKSLTRLEEEVVGDPIITAGGAWTLQSRIWTDALGHPRAIALHKERLIATGSTSYPFTVAATVAGDFGNWGIGDTADDGINRTLASSDIVHWLLSADTLIAGTRSAEWSITGGTNNPLSNQSFFASDPSGSGSLPIRPVRTQDGLLVFVDRSGLRVLVLAFDITVDRLQPDDLTILAEHITESGIKWMTYNQSQNIIWFGLNNNELRSLTFQSKQGVFAWARHAMGGGGVVEWGATVPAEGQDETYLVVRRQIGGNTRRYIEVLDQSAGHWGAAVSDSCVTYSGAATATITGLAHLNGATVGIVADGLVFPDAVVGGGQVTLSQVVSNAEVGLAIDSRVRLLKPTDKSQPQLINASTRVNLGSLYIDVQDTAGVKISKDGTEIDDEMDFRGSGDAFDSVEPLYTGVDVLIPAGSEGDYSEDGSVTLIHDLLTPCMIKEVVRIAEVMQATLEE